MVAQKHPKIEELESVRGLAALLVVIFHIPPWNSGLYDIGIIRNGYLMVELFFVLSGFVIYESYGNKISDLRQLLRFQFLRFGRLYPVHLTFLLLFLFYDLLKYFLTIRFGSTFNVQPFERNSLTAFVQQLLLIQAIGPTGNNLSFNGPSWSISVEFYTYFAFGLIVLLAKTFKIYVFGAVFLVSLICLAGGWAIGFADLARCATGFFLGCLIAHIKDRFSTKLPVYTAFLVTISICAYLQIKKPNHYDIVIYFLTAALILVLLLSEGGLLKRLLRTSVLTWLGRVSYSVYMCHFAVIILVNSVLEKGFKLPIAVVDKISAPQLSFWGAMAAYIAVLGMVLLVSKFTYKYIETPMRERSRRMVLKPAGQPIDRVTAVQ